MTQQLKLAAEYYPKIPTNQVGDEQLANTQPFEAAPHGYGLGLGIVQRLCERNGWTFELNVDAFRVAARLCGECTASTLIAHQYRNR